MTVIEPFQNFLILILINLPVLIESASCIFQDIDNMYYVFNFGKIIEISVKKIILILILKNKFILWPP